MKSVVNFFTLFTSFSTLICCALPALIVALGMGAAMAGFVSEFPQFIWISENKIWFFMVGGVLLTIGGYLQYRVKNEPCPLDTKAQACSDTRRNSKIIYFFSVAMYGIGFSFAYILPRIM